MSDTASILLVAFHFPPESAPGSARPYRFYRYLPEFGLPVQVITAAERDVPVRDIRVVPATTLFPSKYTFTGFTEILLHKLAFPTELALWWAADAMKVGAEVIQKTPIRAIVSTAPPLNTHLAALWLKQKTGLPWIADFRDPLADNPFRLHGSMPERADRWVEQLIFRHADLVIGVTDAMTEDWSARYPHWRHKIRLLWNGYDPAEDLNPVTQPDPTGQKVLAHVGNMYGARHPMALLRVFEKLIRAGTVSPGQFRVKQVGEMKDEVRAISPGTIEYLQERGCMEVHPFMEREQALRHMVTADALMLIDLYGDSKAYAVPSKLYEYIRLGRPILALTQPGSPVSSILERSGVPYRCIDPNQREEEISRALLELMAMPNEPVTPSEWFAENFDGRRQAQTLAQLVKSLESPDARAASEVG